MAQIVAFCLLAPFALVEMLIYHRYDVILLGILYLGLSLQANFAAGRFLRESLSKKDKSRHWSEDEAAEDVELHVHPLGEKTNKSDAAYHPPRPEAILFAEPRIALASAPRVERRRTGQSFSAPNFHGRAHEVLGIEENAATRTIVGAFRHWIKRFHPDQARELPAALANAKVRQLTAAKELLLDRRRNRRA